MQTFLAINKKLENYLHHQDIMTGDLGKGTNHIFQNVPYSISSHDQDKEKVSKGKAGFPAGRAACP